MRALAMALVLALLGAGAAHAAKGPRVIDQVWTHPDFARFNVRSVAMLPPANFEHNLETRCSGLKQFRNERAIEGKCDDESVVSHPARGSSYA